MGTSPPMPTTSWSPKRPAPDPSRYRSGCVRSHVCANPLVDLSHCSSSGAPGAVFALKGPRLESDDPPTMEFFRPDAPGPSIAPPTLPTPSVTSARPPSPVSRISDRAVLDLLDTLPSVASRAKAGARPFPHPFPARMPLEVATAIVKCLSAPRDTVLDPMLGSGTTMAAALALGRRGIGCDTDPLAVLLSTARCRPGRSRPLAAAIERVAQDAKRRVGDLRLDELHAAIAVPEDVAFLDRWFPPATQLRLSALVDAVMADPDLDTRAGLLALFSSTIVTKQGGVTFGLDVSRSRAHFSADKNPADAFAEWTRRARAFIRYADMVPFALITSSRMIMRADARQLPLPDATADLIVTSPPYLDAIDYMRASRFTLVWLGHTLAAMRAIRGDAIGTERGLSSGVLPEPIERLLRDSPAHPRRQPMLRRYLVDMLATLRESRRCTKLGGLAVYVVGPSLLTRRRYDGGDAERIRQMPVLFQQVARLARRGRKRWLGLGFITQLPQHLPDEVLALINNWILHKIQDVNVINRLRRVIPGVDEAMWRSMPAQPPGEAIVSFTHLKRPVTVSMDASPCRLRMVE